MKNFKIEIEKANAIYGMKQENKRKIEEVTAEKRIEIEKIRGFLLNKQKPNKTRYNELEQLQIELYQEKEKLQIVGELQKSNVRQVLYKESLPIILEILEKYQGKPHGEKTAKKISNEVYEKTNCRFWIYDKYSTPMLCVSPDGLYNKYEIEISTKYNSGNQKLILIDNKIQKVDIEEFEMYGKHEYIEDVFAETEKIQAKRLKVLAKKEELEALCKEYNNMIAGNIESLYFRKA